MNLLVPGAGLVLLGEPAIGVLLGLLYAALLNLLIASCLIFPDELSSSTTLIATIGAAAVYVFAQRRLPAAESRTAMMRITAQRRAALKTAAECIQRGDGLGARAALLPIADRAEDDLLLAYRMAQAASLCGDAAAAREAWRRVRKLDRHRIYGDDIERYLGRAGDS